MKALVPVSMDVGKSITLAGIEERLKTAENCDPGGEAVIHLARHLGSNFFVESRVASLIATLSNRQALTVRDWHNAWETPEVDRFFKARLSGFTALMNARYVDNDSAQVLPVTPAEVRTQTNSRGGVLERNITLPPPAGGDLFLPGIEMTKHPEGRSITICAMDSSEQRATPFVFSGLMQDRKKFAATLLGLKRNYLEKGRTSALENLDQLSAEQALATFVFETFQNSFEHGCQDEHGLVIPGVRSIMLRKHVTNDPAGFVGRAKGYPALEEYMRQVISPSRHTKLLEVSISDQGLGILRRYSSTSGEATDSTEVSGRDRRKMLQQIIEEPLSSKRSFPGAGQGLARVTEAVKTLEGFLSVRTDRVWLSYGRVGERYGFSGVDVAPVVGTHINLLFPLRSV